MDGGPADNIEDGVGDVVEIDVDDSGDSEDDDIFGMEGFSNSPVVKSEPPNVRRSTRRSTRKIHVNEVDESPIPKKKKKRGNRSKYQNTDEGHMFNMSQPTRSNSVDQDMLRQVSRAHNNLVPSTLPKYLPAMGSSPNQRLEQAQFHHNTHVFGYHPYGSTAPSLPPLHLDHNGGFYSQNVLPFTQLNQQYSGYSSGTDHEYLEQAQ